MKTLTQIRADREEAALNVKIASVREALGDDPVVIETLDRAIDIVKEAGVTNPEEQLDIATQLTIDHLGLNKTAEEAPAANADDDAECAAAAEAGIDAARAAFEAGVTTDDLNKIASAEEMDLFGRLLAHVVTRGN